MIIMGMKISEILKLRTIAIVGLSRSPEKDSYSVAEYLKSRGYVIVPVNPMATEILGEKCHVSLKDIPFPVDIVDVFRPSADVLYIAKEAAELKGKTGKPLVFWMQLGIENPEARKIAEDAGMTVIENKCIKVEHELLT
ncbi:MAG: CoA-binding protein [Candidatus Aenigmarchaeota archaeon]|nr:CoA-binding protein [Candidatus Aenigmarchaeota archaeon]